ncbi:hypothetical protein QQ056_12455 [Oscillatoria laete-virens NRMC-F 0139]|nr:hypothetical protein [Oscillatoria laete-virens]MDL5054349.1 hypothetical protein [Oscillatoria laete-virens NRMC-F 0139]
MNFYSSANILRVFFLILMGVGGYFSAYSEIFQFWEKTPWKGAFSGLAIGLVVILIDRLLKGFSLRAFSSATFGLVLGCLMAWLVRESRMFYFADLRVQWLINLVTYLSFGYLGMMLALRSNKDEFSLIIPYVKFMRQDSPEFNLVLDTSAIIDGRIRGLFKLGLIDGAVFVPRFVLRELQALADSGDPIKRERGRRGLDIVKELQSDNKIDLTITESDYPDEPNVDEKLIRAAKILSAKIVTTDFNLEKVATIQKVRVININSMSEALKPSLIAGDAVHVHLVKEGRDPGQAVGYLPDGTMIVVNNAAQHTGQSVEAKVIGSLQTSAGRLIFAELKNSTPIGNT